MDGIPISEEPEARKSATQILGDELFQVRKQSSDLGRAKVKLASPQIVMIVTKSLEAQFVIFARQLSLFLITRARKCSAGGLSVLVDIKLKTNATFQVLLDQYPELSSKIAYWTPEYCANNHAKIDFILTLGGDGTILYTAWLFQHSQVPPIIPFHLGSLGFLTVFKISDITRVLDMALGCSSIGHGVCLNMRVRLACTIWRKSSSAVKLPKVKTLLVNQSLVTLSVSQGLVSDGNEAAPLRRSSTDESFAGPVTYIPGQTFHIINDVVVDRGPSAYMSQLELFVDNVHLTTSQADGIVVATPTGSTAYSVSKI